MTEKEFKKKKREYLYYRSAPQRERKKYIDGIPCVLICCGIWLWFVVAAFMKLLE